MGDDSSLVKSLYEWESPRIKIIHNLWCLVISLILLIFGIGLLINLITYNIYVRVLYQIAHSTQQNIQVAPQSPQRLTIIYIIPLSVLRFF